MREFTNIEQDELPSEAVKAAITILTIGPIILLYPFLQKYFIQTLVYSKISLSK